MSGLAGVFNRGPRGGGAPSSGGSSTPPPEILLSLLAGEPILAHRAVRYNAATGRVFHADNASVTTAWPTLGLSVTAQPTVGSTVQIRRRGFIDDLGWTWEPNRPVFLGNAGALVQNRVAVGVQLVVGVALTSTRLDVRPSRPLIRV